MEMIINDKTAKPLMSIILVDWSVRESFHSLKYLNNQTFPRDKYEIIWIEFYDRKPLELQEGVGIGRQKSNQPILDKWIVLGNSTEIYYHKHLLYNIGIIIADGEICVICDSDAIFTPTFVESIFNAFKIDSSIVIHLDEVRNISERFYPFNYPEISEIIGKGCVNWAGHTTTGLNNSPDILHEANYGACMCALRRDLIKIGGADEHTDYLGHICGPYEMTFRLVNHGKHEKWLSHEWLYHVWHPGESGDNNYGGPHDGRGLSLRALEARETGRILPVVENPALKKLRTGAQKNREELISILENHNRENWKISIAALNSVHPPKLIEENYSGFNIICYKGAYYGLSQREGAFDPIKVASGEYQKCYSGKSKEEVKEKIDSKTFFYLFPMGKHIMNLIKNNLNRTTQSNESHPFSASNLGFADQPLLVKENYLGFNIIHYRDLYYGLEQGEGPFDIAKVINKGYKRCYYGKSEEEVIKKIKSESFLRIYRKGRNIKSVRIKNAIKKAVNALRRLSVSHQLEAERASVAVQQGQLERERSEIAAKETQLEEERAKVSALQELVDKGRSELEAQREQLEAERATIATEQSRLDQERAEVLNQKEQLKEYVALEEIYNIDKNFLKEIAMEINLLRHLDEVKFPQTSLCDRKFLYRCARMVPKNGMIVEIGTAQGGSAFLFSMATQERNVKIVSIDKLASQEARENLKGKNVFLITADSIEYAKEWGNQKNKSIDLLFIDGGHTLIDVYNDYNHWSHFVRPGGMIILHDYDAIYDGGVNHLGIRVFGDALLNMGIIESPIHEDNCLLGFKPLYESRNISLKECKGALINIGKNINKIINGGARAIQVWEQTYSKFLRLSNFLYPENQLISFSILDGRKCFIIKDDYYEIADKLLLDNHEQQTAYADLVTICYLFHHLLNNIEYDRMLDFSRDRGALFHWHEGLSMFDTAIENNNFPCNLDHIERFDDTNSLSKFIASEQIKLLMLMELEKSCL
jgi:predicted O-methyltransferase YrrM